MGVEDTLLTAAAKSGEGVLFERLIKAGADMSIKNEVSHLSQTPTFSGRA